MKTDEIPNDFWREYENADYLKQQELLLSLPTLQNVTREPLRYDTGILARIVQDYLLDYKYYLLKRGKK